MAEITARRWLCRGLATVGAALLATTASAQAADTARMPVWDAGGSMAVRSTRASDLGEDGYYDDWEGQWEPGAQVGRHVTKHLKVELGLRGPMHYEFFDAIRVPAPALPGGFADTYVDRHVRVLSFAPAITWQFFENTFVHPYVSAGVAMDIADTHRFRQAGTESYVPRTGTTIRYDVPGIDTRETVIEARPFFAAGTKSYFGNGQWFVRPEIEIGITKSRIGRFSLRLGVGVDF